MHALKSAIVATYSNLVRATGHAFPSIADVLRESGVARSTLYKHFDDRSALLVEALSAPFETLAVSTQTGQVSPDLIALFEHFWVQRRGIADLLATPHANRVANGLCLELRSKISGLTHADAIRIAHSQIAFLRLWATGETPCAPDEMAAKFVAASAALLAAATVTTTGLPGQNAFTLGG